MPKAPPEIVERAKRWLETQTGVGATPAVEEAREIITALLRDYDFEE